MTQPVTQRSFVKGLDASTDKFDQPRGSLPRISNLLFTRRGSLLTVDGSQSLMTPSGAFNPTLNQGAIISIQQYLTGAATLSAVQATPSGVFFPAGIGVSAAGGNTPWSNSGNITSEDGQVASATIFQGFSTNLLVATGFNLAIPSGSTINGIQAKIKKSATNNFIFDSTVRLVKANVPSGTDHSLAAAWGLSLATTQYGAVNDLWGTTVTPTDTNSTGFGVCIAAVNSNPHPISGTVNVDIIYLAVSYTTAGGVSKVQTGQALLYLQDSNPGTQLGEVTGLTLTGINTAGGTLTPGNTYTYGISVLDGQQNASAGVSASLLLAGGLNAITISFNPVLGAGSYLIQSHIGAITTSTPQIAQVFQPDIKQTSAGFVTPPTISYTDKTNAAVTLNNYPYGIIIWATNSTIGPLRLFITGSTNVGAGVYQDPILLAQFPCRGNDSSIPNIPPTDMNGNVLGGSCQVPQLIQFDNLIVIALGNGIRPFSTDGTTVSPFTNTFTAIYITWVASTTYLVGDTVIPPTPNGFFYTCTQGGQTGGSAPAFPTVINQTVADNQVIWTCTGQVTSSPPPRGAAHVAYHAGSLWFLNTSPGNTSDNLDGPSVLGMSDTDSVNSFNPVNRAFIGKDDGSEGTGLASFTIAEFGIAPLGSLLAFKNFSTYQIVGVFGAQDFTIQQLQTNMGCVAPRSIQYLSGFGIIRLSHLGFAMTDGVRDKLLSEQIRPFLFGSPSTGSAGLPPITGIDLNHVYLVKGDQSTNPPMYMAAAPLQGNISLNRIFLYDLVLKSWTIIDLPSSMNPTSFISAIYQVRTPGFSPYTIIGGFDSGSIQIIQNGSGLWNLSTIPVAINWSVTTPEIFNTGDPSGEVYVSNLLLRVSNLDGNPITVTLNINNEGGTTADRRVYEIGTGESEIMFGVNEQAISFNAIISGTGRVELLSFTWNVQPKPSGIPARIT